EPIEPVGRLVEILEQDDAADERGLQGRAAQAGENREVAAAQRPLGAARDDSVGRPMDPPWVLSGEKRAEPFERGTILAELGAHRAVDARHPCAPPGHVQPGPIAVADARPGMSCDHIDWYLPAA